jgi:hypothetical protein
MSVQTAIYDLPQWQRELYMGGVGGMPGIIPGAFAATRAQGPLPMQTVAGFDEGTPQQVWNERAQQALTASMGGWAPYMESAQGAFGTAAQQLGAGDLAMRYSTGAAQQFPAAYGVLQHGAGIAGLTTDQALSALQGTGEMYDPSMTQAFMDPYRRDVVEAQQREMQRLADIQRQSIRAQGASSGAFGGTREAVQQAELTRNLMDQQSRLSAELMSQGYTQAQANSMAAFEASRQRQMQSATTVGQLGQSYADLMRQSGLGLGALAEGESNIYRQAGLGQGALAEQMGMLGSRQVTAGAAGQEMAGQDVSRAMGLAEYYRGVRQQQLDADFANRMAQWQMPLQQQQWLADIVRGTPSGQTSMVQTTQPQQGWGTQAAALGLTALGMMGGGRTSSGGFGFGG